MNQMGLKSGLLVMSGYVSKIDEKIGTAINRNGKLKWNLKVEYKSKNKDIQVFIVILWSKIWQLEKKHGYTVHRNPKK